MKPLLTKSDPLEDFLHNLRGRPLVVSIVTVEELLEGRCSDVAQLSDWEKTMRGWYLPRIR